MNLLRAIYRWFERPHRLLAVWPAVSRPGATLLDVGCGNHSPSLTKRHLPQCVYHGLDRQNWNRDERDLACIDRFFDSDLSRPEGLAAVPEAAYDAVICSHVLEHLPNPEAVIKSLAAKVKPGGRLYLEVPSPHSVRLPRAIQGWYGIRGCLNFYDDVTHQTLVALPRLAEQLQRQGFRVSPIRYRFLWRRILLLPGYVLAGLVLRGYVPASVVWDITGFAQSLVAERPTSVAASLPASEVTKPCQAA